MPEKLIDQLIFIVEQRIAAALYAEKVEEKPLKHQDLSPYSWFVSQGGDKFVKYTVECLQEVPISYTSKTGFLLVFTPEDTVHTAFLKILKAEYDTGVIDGRLALKDHKLELDLTGN